MTFSVIEAIDRHVGALEKERQPDGMWHPSSLSTSCLRQAVYVFRGVPKSDPVEQPTKRVFRIGHILHQFAQDAVMGEVGNTIKAFYSEVEIDIPELNITGSVDGVLEMSDGTWLVLEFKSTKKSGLAFGLKAEHVVQVACYLHALREHGSPAREIPPLGDKLTGAIVAYIEKEALEIREYEVAWTDELREELVARAAALASYETGTALPERVKRTKFPCGYCNYRTLCWEGNEE